MNKHHFLKFTSCLTGAGLFFFSSGCLPFADALANPVDGNVVRGQASITQTGNVVDVHQSSRKAVIDWRSFDIGAGEKTQFHQPDSGSVTLNRVGHGPASQIHGELKANGNVIIVNPNGVIIGSGAHVDVNGLVATTADIDNQRFMDGDLRFDKPGNPDARVENHGTITAKEAGLVGLVAPNVLNSGVINARLGRVQLASGDTATLDLYGNGLMEVQVGDAVKSQVVENRGVINAQGGTIAITAAAAKEVVNSLVTVAGELNAPTVGVKNGKIIIAAEGSNAVAGNVAENKGIKQGESRVLVAGKLNASGLKAGEKGGNITITADAVALASTAKVNASGHSGGGTVKVGGAYQGKGNTATAKRVHVAEGAVLSANATAKGNGGEVIVWSDIDTAFAGRIEAKGGANSGNGGFAEVSGKQWLDFRGVADLSAAHGSLGALLLDPTSITITTADSAPAVAWDPVTFTFSDSGAVRNSATIDVQHIIDQLNISDVTLTTASSGAGAGNILVHAPIIWNGTGSLSLIADGNIDVGGRDAVVAPGNIIYQGNNDVAVTLRANHYIGLFDGSSIYVDTASGATGRIDVTLHSNYNNNVGALRLEGGSSIRSNGGFIVMGGGLDPWTDFALGDNAYFSGIRITGTSGAKVLIDASGATGAGGDIVMNGAASGVAPTSPNRGVYYQYTTIRTNGDGDITLRGDAGNGTNINNEGINLTDSVVQVQNGSVYMEGNGASGVQFTHGINLARTSITSTAITATPSTIHLKGAAGDATVSDQSGIIIGDGSSINSGYADIILEGTGGNGAGNRARGVSISGIVQSTGNGNDAADISITGVAGSGTGLNNDGVQLQGVASGSRISSVDGDMDIKGTAGANSSGQSGVMFTSDAGQSSAIFATGDGEITLTGLATGSVAGIESSGAGSYAVGNATGTGNVRFIADSAGALSGLAVESGSDVIWRPYTAGRDITLGSGGGAGSLNITDAILAGITSYQTLWLGGESGLRQSGDITINSNAALNGNVNVVSGSDILFTGGTLGKTTGAALVDWNFLADGDIATSGGAGVLASSGGINLLFQSGYGGAAGKGVSIGAGSSFQHNGTLTFVADGLSSLSALSGEVNWFTDAALPTASFVADNAQLNFAALTSGLNLSIGTGAGCDVCLSDATVAALQQGFSGGQTYGADDAGAITNRTATWNTPVTFRTGGGFTNAVAVAATDNFHVVADGDITLNGAISTTGAGADALVLAAGGRFISNAGAGALSATNSRWLVYSATPTTNQRNGLLPDASDFGKTYAANAPATIGAGNRFVYAASTRPDLVLRVNNDTVEYGLPYAGSGAYSYVSGLIGGDSLATIGLSGAPLYHAAYTVGDGVGVKNGALTATLNGFASPLGYNITFMAGNLTVLPVGGVVITPPVVLPPTVERVQQDPSIMYDVQHVASVFAEDPAQSLAENADEVMGADDSQKGDKPRAGIRHWLGGLLEIHPTIRHLLFSGKEVKEHVS